MAKKAVTTNKIDIEETTVLPAASQSCRVEVFLLGKFDITVDGVSVLQYLPGASKSVHLLKFLILNRTRPVSIVDLTDAFWAEERIANPENALKTMISRTRASLAKADPALRNCIVAIKGAYCWNPDLPCNVDVEEFEQLCSSLMATPAFGDEQREAYFRLLSVYQGDLAPSSSGEEGMATRSLFLHNLYLKTVHRFIEHLKTAGDDEMVIHVCRIAIDIDAFDEGLNMELMGALKRLGRNNVALSQYNHVTELYYKYLGIEPSERMLNFYKELIKSDLAAKADIGTIRETLLQSEVLGGAFVCDFSIFRDIYQLQVRNLERSESEMYLVLITVENRMGETFEPFVLDAVMHDLMASLQATLRKGDSISRYSSSQFAVLLPMRSKNGRDVVFERIRKLFYKKHINSNIMLTFQLEAVRADD